jgi:hypothetical protein
MFLLFLCVDRLKQSTLKITKKYHFDICYLKRQTPKCILDASLLRRRTPKTMSRSYPDRHGRSKKLKAEARARQAKN